MIESAYSRKYITDPIRKGFPGAWIEKVPGSPFNKGLPDHVSIIEGIGVVIEAKKHPKTTPTPLQERKLRDAARSGGIALCVIFMPNREIHAINFTDWERTASRELCKRIIACLGITSVRTAGDVSTIQI